MRDNTGALLRDESLSSWRRTEIRDDLDLWTRRSGLSLSMPAQV